MHRKNLFPLLCVLLFLSNTASAFNYSVQFNDNGTNDFANRGWLSASSDFQKNIFAAIDIWAGLIDSNETLTIHVSADNSVARTGGTFSNGRVLSAEPLVVEPGPLSKVLTGTNPANEFDEPDIFIDINSQFVEDFYWFDPTPADRSNESVPLGKTDFVSIIIHEMGHGLGIAGRRVLYPDSNNAYGEFYSDAQNSFDFLSYFGGNGNPLNSSGLPNPMFFEGLAANDIVGSDASLSHTGPGSFYHSQDFYHLGTCGDPKLYTHSLMNGCSVPTDGTRLEVTAIDLALIVDLGYPSAVTGACNAPDGLDLILTAATVTTTQNKTACRTVFAGPDYTVASTGTLTLNTGKMVSFVSGFSVQTGGTLKVNMDRTLREMP